MLRQKALRKIFITTMSVFIIMSIYLIPITEKSITTNLEFEYVTDLANSSIYLLDDNNFLVKTKILLDNKELNDNIKTIITNLTINDNAKFPDKLSGLIPKGTKLNNISLEDNTLTLDFSKELLNIDKELSKKLIESLTFSLTELKEVEAINLKVENNLLEYFPNTDIPINMPLTRSIGINNKYDYTTLNNINKVVIYYQELIDDEVYYVPVTKYLNNEKDKIDIIVEELTTSYIYENNLSSIINENTKLIDKELTDDLLILNFNSALFDSNSAIKEEVLYMISYSAFANYDVNTVSFKVEGKEVENVKRSSLT